MSKTSRKTGFTLVELLVVIAIIGILVGMLLPAINAVRRRAVEFTINNDVTRLEQALESFQSEYGFYPPDMSEINSAQEFLPWLGKISRSHQEGNGRDGGGLQIWWNQVGQHLDNESALVFWLSGFSQNKQYPLTVAGGSGGSGRVAIPAYPVGGDEINRVVKFEFPNNQLVINGQVASFVQRRGVKLQPYVYFHSGSYDTASHATSLDGSVVMPYFSASGFPEGSDGTFQIIAAGVDGEFGSTGDLQNLTTEDNDNVCSFSDGRLAKILN